MKWIIEYWYLIVAGLAFAAFFGYRTKSDQVEMTGTHDEEQKDEKTKKSGHSCCH
jgi:hypothetical protein